MNLEKVRNSPDFSKDDFVHAVEIYINKAYYPKYDLELGRISEMSKSDIGENGELVSIVPFYVKYKSASYIPPFSQSKITKDRENVGIKDNGSFLFPLEVSSDSMEYTAHNALYTLNNNMIAVYAAPLFYRKKKLSVLKRARVVQPWKYDEVSIYEDKILKGKTVLNKIPLLNETVVIHPGKKLDGKGEHLYYSYSKDKEICFHGPENTSEKVNAGDNYRMNSFLEEIISTDFQDYDLRIFSEDILEMIPSLFDSKWSSRKMKFIFENILFNYIDEASLPANYTFQQLLDSLGVYEKVLVLEKILQQYFGIIQYFRFKFRN